MLLAHTWLTLPFLTLTVSSVAHFDLPKEEAFCIDMEASQSCQPVVFFCQICRSKLVMTGTLEHSLHDKGVTSTQELPRLDESFILLDRGRTGPARSMSCTMYHPLLNRCIVPTVSMNLLPLNSVRAITAPAGPSGRGLEESFVVLGPSPASGRSLQQPMVAHVGSHHQNQQVPGQASAAAAPSGGALQGESSAPGLMNTQMNVLSSGWAGLGWT